MAGKMNTELNGHSGLVEITVTSSLDGSREPSLFFMPRTEHPVPLVVGLHTWSYDRFNQASNYLPLCQKRGWALLLPEFRGSNLIANPRIRQAGGAALARQDILDAVHAVCVQNPIDTSCIFLLGCSGGGHAALLVAGDSPKTFRAVDVWCPVTDLQAWHAYHCSREHYYVKDIEACAGGMPEECPEEYAFRSPSAHPERLKELALSIHHGRHDLVVPFRHSVSLTSAVDAAGSDTVYLDVFDGGHEQMPARSFEWFAKLAGTSKSSVAITG